MLTTIEYLTEDLRRAQSKLSSIEPKIYTRFSEHIYGLHHVPSYKRLHDEYVRLELLVMQISKDLSKALAN